MEEKNLFKLPEGDKRIVPFSSLDLDPITPPAGQTKSWPIILSVLSPILYLLSVFDSQPKENSQFRPKIGFSESVL